MNRTQVIESLNKRIDATWAMAQAFLDNRDAHGIMDMGAELQSLERALKEVEKIPPD